MADTSSVNEDEIAPAPASIVRVLRNIALAQGKLAKLQALSDGAHALAIPVRHGLLNYVDVIDRLLEQCGNCGLLEDPGEAAVLAIITPRLNDLTIPADAEAEAVLNEGLRAATALHDVPRVGRPEKVFNAVELTHMQFEPIKAVVPGIFVEGLSLLVGKPKIGKSWLLLHAAHAIASSGFTLGEIHCIEGDVLYCALEDTERRLKSRMKKLFGNEPRSPRLNFTVRMGRLLEGGLDFLRAWIASVKNPRLIAIDTLAMVRMPNRRDQSVYDADYAALVELRHLAQEFGIAIVVVHHLRKMEADDPFDTISGTLGLTGSTDSIVLLHRETNCTTLRVRGRDLEEIEKAITFNKNACIWTIQGDASEVRQSEERQSILNALREMDGPQTPSKIAPIAGMRLVNLRKLLPKMAKDGLLQKVGYGKYEITPKPETFHDL
jgi:hypothetical protein